MRKVRYGRFVDFMPPMDDYDNGLIGGHIYTRHAEEESLKTAGYEYYVVKNKRRVTIDDATALEKMVARFIFLFEPKKKRVLGERSTTKVNPYSSPTPQLGVKLDENGEKTVDKAYYEKHEEKVISNPMKSNEEKIEELKEIRDALTKAEEEIEEEKKSGISK